MAEAESNVDKDVKSKNLGAEAIGPEQLELERRNALRALTV